MKKICYILAALFVGMQLQSCSKDDDVKTVSELEEKFFTIENAEYFEGNFPEATTTEKLQGVDMSNQVMNGAMNYVTVVTDQKVSKFFLAAKEAEGYYEYVPEEKNTTSEDYNSYVIPVMMSQSYSGNSTMVLSGELDNGTITKPVETELTYIETKVGALEVKLSFSNSKDIDLHLYTPNDEHIYYGNRGGTYVNADGEEISYGLDVDSNAGCSIDNINKENIYIPEELVEDGVYTVVVNMYSNCNSSIATNWSIVTRYQGELITPIEGSNPASG
ncbi:MAG: hypothetical protein K2G75_03200, partial [Muribaculaceae bacterium]|nr:hypothetical protein [Muribaculaceae bacterium]